MSSGGGGSGSGLQRVGGIAYGVNFTSMDVSIPTHDDGDIAIAAIVYNPDPPVLSGTTGVPSTPSGWTLLTWPGSANQIEYSASMHARLYWKSLTSGDSTASFTWTDSSKASAAIEVFRGVTGVDSYDSANSFVTPSITPTTPSVIVSFAMERSSSPSTSVTTYPSGMTAGVSDFLTLGGATSIATAYVETEQPASLFNPGDWDFSGSGTGNISFTVALEVT